MVTNTAAQKKTPRRSRVRWLSAEEQEAWKTVAMLFLEMEGCLDAQLQRDSGISMFDYMVLSSLSMSPDRTLRMSELAKLANGSLSRLSNVAKRLEQRGWMQRYPDPDDGRYTIAKLTDSGWDLVVAAAPGHVEIVRRLVIDPLSVTQVRTLASIGRRLSAALEQPRGG